MQHLAEVQLNGHRVGVEHFENWRFSVNRLRLKFPVSRVLLGSLGALLALLSQQEIVVVVHMLFRHWHGILELKVDFVFLVGLHHFLVWVTLRLLENLPFN